MKLWKYSRNNLKKHGWCLLLCIRINNKCLLEGFIQIETLIFNSFFIILMFRTFVFNDRVGTKPLACRSTYDFQHDKEELYFGIQRTRSWVIDSSILAPTVSIKKSFFLLDFHFLRMFHFSTIVYFIAIVLFVVDCFF